MERVCMPHDNNKQYTTKTRYFNEHIDQIRERVHYTIARRGLSISQAAREAGVSRPVMDGFVHNDNYYPNTRTILRILYFLGQDTWE